MIEGETKEEMEIVSKFDEEAENEEAENTNDKKSDEPEKTGKPDNAKRKKKKKDTIFYWALALIAAVLILFFAANKFYSNDSIEYETITYNNWEFTKILDLWWFEWQKGENLYSIPLRFNPYMAEDVPTTGKLDTEKFNAKKYVYITFDLSNESSQNFTILALAATELTQNIATAINRTPLAACTNSINEACETRLVKTCSNTDEPVIYLEEGGEAEVFSSGACITLKGEGMELVRAVDRLLYHWYRIIQND